MKHALRLLPVAEAPSHVSHIAVGGGHEDYLVHDTLRQGPKQVRDGLEPGHPIESINKNVKFDHKLKYFQL